MRDWNKITLEWHDLYICINMRFLQLSLLLSFFFQLCIINLWDMLAIQLRKQYELTTYAIWKLGFQPKSSVLN